MSEVQDDLFKINTETKNWALPIGEFDVVIADPPWDYWGSPDKWAAAGKFYSLMSDADMQSMPVAKMMAKPSLLFMWVTSSSLARAIDCIRAWRLHYRGVAFVWVKTKADGTPIGAQGVRPSITKPLTEMVLVASTEIKGRPLPLSDESIRQTIFAPRTEHSQKPESVQDAIDKMYPTARKAELFARRVRPGWTCWGNEVPEIA